MKLIGEQIREAREKLGLSQPEFAQKAGLSRSQLIRIEMGRTWQPRRATLTRLALALGLNAGDLFGFTPNASGVEESLWGHITKLSDSDQAVVGIFVRALLQAHRPRERSVPVESREAALPAAGGGA